MGDLFRRSCHCCSIALLLLIAVVSATAQENPTWSADTVLVFVQKTSGAANIYYPDVGHGSSVDIWCGQLRVGRLRRGGKLTLTLPPARYWLRDGGGVRSEGILSRQGRARHSTAIPAVPLQPAH
jgi:hypothetical protein